MSSLADALDDLCDKYGALAVLNQFAESYPEDWAMRSFPGLDATDRESRPPIPVLCQKHSVEVAGGFTRGCAPPWANCDYKTNQQRAIEWAKFVRRGIDSFLGTKA